VDKISEVPTVVLPILSTLFLGWFSRRKNILNDESVNGIKSLVMQFMLPAVLLGAFYKTVFNAELILIAVCMFFCCLAGLGLGLLFVRTYKGDKNIKILPFLTCGFEAGMMGYGLYAMLFPPEDLHNFAMVDLGQVLFVFTVYSAMLNKQKGFSTKQTLKSTVTSPVFISIVLGVALSASGIGFLIQQSALGKPLDVALNYIGTPTGALMIFVVGYQLVWSKSGMRESLLTVALRAVIMAVLCAVYVFVLKNFMEVSVSLFWAIILMFTLPAPFVLPFFSEDEKQKGYVATTLSTGTVLSIVFFSIISILR